MPEKKLWLKPDSVRRLIVLVVGAAAVVLQDKLGVQLSDTDIAALAGMISAYILGSNYRAAKNGVQPPLQGGAPSMLVGGPHQAGRQEP